MLSFAICSFTALAFFAISTTAQCNTNQNPRCAGEPRFEQLCCPSPAACYWSNRNGDPACCAAGQDCRADGGPGTTVVVPVTYVQVTTAYATSVYTQPQQTVTYTPPATTQQFTSVNTVATPAVVVVASSNPPATANGAFITVTANVAVSISHSDSITLLTKASIASIICFLLGIL